MRSSSNLLLAVLLLCSACYTSEVKLDPEGQVVDTGFLSDYSMLQQSMENEGAWVYVNPNKTLRLYKMLMLDPVEVRLTEPAPGMDRRKLDRLARRFEQEIRNNLGSSYPIVQQPGWGVLRMRVAITGIEPSSPVINSIPGVRETGAGLGGASMEAEFLDTQTKEVVAAVVDSKKGKAYRRTTGFTKTSDAEECMREWSLTLKDRLDVIQGLYSDSDVRSTGTRYR